MEVHAASNFLSMPAGDDIGKYYIHQIEALDLQTTVASNLNSNDDCVSQYLDVCENEKQQLPFEEEDYLDFLIICLQDFYKNYEDYLFSKLANKAGGDSAEDFFDRLRKIEPDADTEVILSKYLFVQINTEMNVCEEKAVEVFENISNILCINNYKNSKLSLLLIRAVSFDSYLPSFILGATNSPTRLDYILRHMKEYCIEKRCTDVFLEFKRKNSIIPCVEAGRKDLLEVLLKYGSWNDFSTIDIYSWMYECFGTTSEDSLDIVEFLIQQGYDLKRFLLILQYCYAFLIPLKKISLYLSTIQLFWRSIPYPYLSSEEMRTILIITTQPEEHFKVRSACELYHQTLCPGKLEPRSLKHYARYAIRSVLDQKALLPEGIDCLDVPEICRSYLRLKY